MIRYMLGERQQEGRLEDKGRSACLGEEGGEANRGKENGTTETRWGQAEEGQGNFTNLITALCVLS